MHQNSRAGEAQHFLRKAGVKEIKPAVALSGPLQVMI
jgi:hypothetical protein